MQRWFGVGFAVLLGGVVVAVMGCATPASERPGAIAEAYAAAGRYDEASREVDLAVRGHPDNPELRKLAARIHGKSGDLPRAISHLEVGIRLAPNDAELWLQLAEFENQRQNVGDAYVAYRRVAELAPDDIRGVRGLALAADSLGFADEAKSAYARWAELERKLEDPISPRGR